MPLLPIEHHLQQVETGCLAACVQTVLAHLKIESSQHQLNRILGLTSLGVPFSQITRVERFGVTVTLVTGEEPQIREQIDLGNPVIVPVLTGQLDYWHGEDTQQAITVVGYNDTAFLINDSAFAETPQSAGWIEFMLAREIYNDVYAIITR